MFFASVSMPCLAFSTLLSRARQRAKSLAGTYAGGQVVTLARLSNANRVDGRAAAVAQVDRQQFHGAIVRRDGAG